MLAVSVGSEKLSESGGLVGVEDTKSEDLTPPPTSGLPSASRDTASPSMPSDGTRVFHGPRGSGVERPGPVFTFRVPTPSAIYGSHPPTDRGVVHAVVIGDLLLGVAVLKARVSHAGGVFRVGDEGCTSKVANTTGLADSQNTKSKELTPLPLAFAQS